VAPARPRDVVAMGLLLAFQPIINVPLTSFRPA